MRYEKAVKVFPAGTAEKCVDGDFGTVGKAYKALIEHKKVTPMYLNILCDGVPKIRVLDKSENRVEPENAVYLLVFDEL